MGSAGDGDSNKKGGPGLSLAAFSSSKKGGSEVTRIEPYFRVEFGSPTYDPRAEGLGQAPRSITAIIADLKSALGMPATQGDVEPAVQNGWSQWLGRIRARPNATRDDATPSAAAHVRLSTDIEAIAHEGGHRLEHAIGQPLQDLLAGNASELWPYVGQGASAPWLSAGFAEFFTDYVLAPDRAETRAPQFYKAFDDLLDAERPDISEGLDRVQLTTLSKDYQDYIKALRGSQEKRVAATAEPARPLARHQLSRSAKETAMAPNVLAAAILAASIIVGSAMFAGRYTMSDRPSGSSSVYILDRFTGQVRRCTFDECAVLSTEPK